MEDNALEKKVFSILFFVLHGLFFLGNCYMLFYYLEEVAFLSVEMRKRCYNLFLFSVFMMISSYLSLYFVDPGKIPENFGMESGESEQFRTRYCLVCQSFKPERTHHFNHIGVNRCVLGAHSSNIPFIAIGFFNFKYFVLYVTFNYIAFSLGMTCATSHIYKLIYSTSTFFSVLNLIFYILFYLQFLLIYIGYTFLLLKVWISVIYNKKDDFEEGAEGEKFNISLYHNWITVFGVNPLFWFLPFPCKFSKPYGDGIMWKIKETLITS